MVHSKQILLASTFVFFYSSLELPRLQYVGFDCMSLLRNTFTGYAPDESGKEKWAETDDVARIDEQGSIEVVTNMEDVIYDNNSGLVEHWNIERLLNQNDLIKGVQVVLVGRGQQVTAVCVLRNPQANVTHLLQELVKMCKKNKFPVPDLFAFVHDFPRIHTKIQKYRKLRNAAISVF